MADNPQQARSRQLSVSEVTRIIKGLVETEPALANVWIRGEASNVKLAGSGHLYFTLKDESSQLNCAFFAFGKRRKQAPSDGDELLVHGDVRVYEARGVYQLYADDLIRAGAGDLAAKFEALKAKLLAEGLFDGERKVARPLVPRTIAICTGIATAALQDVLNILRRRAPYLRAVVFPCSVQGDSAPPEIIAALQAADACPEVDVILLVRGGGSIEDLWCFNDETLARALAEIKRPVITGVGHEVDTTIVDFIADQRAPTPSAAAELVAPDVLELRGGTDNLTQRMLRGTLGELADTQAALQRMFDGRLIRDVVGRVEGGWQELDGFAEQLAESAAERTGLGEEPGYDPRLDRMAAMLKRSVEDYAHKLPRWRDDVLRAGRQGLEGLAAKLKAKQAELQGLDPSAPKKLGFALVWNEAGDLVRNPEQVKLGERLKIEVKDGDLWAKRE